MGGSELRAFAEGVLQAGPERASDLGMLLVARSTRWVVGRPELQVVAKVYLAEPRWGWLIALVLGTRADRAARKLSRARALGVSVPGVRYVHESRVGSVVVMDFIDGRPLREMYFALIGRDRRSLVSAVARFLGRIHDAGVYPSDFNDTNVLVTDFGEPVLIDPEGLRFVGWVSSRRRVRNLERLLRAFLGQNGVPLSTRFRFLVEYAGGNSGLARRRARELFEAIGIRFRRKQRQYDLGSP
ncbi:MAG: hypothetical protein HY791_31010 [Deltaproteobacteria bacterium]|nr:hypothetical protein [Deltaproteobacteria bacterium]